MRELEAARMAEGLVIVPQRAAERRAGVGRARRHPDAPHVGMLQDLGIGHAVERDAARHAQVALREPLQQRAHEVQDDLLRDRLQREGQVAVLVGERLVRRTRAARRCR